MVETRSRQTQTLAAPVSEVRMVLATPPPCPPGKLMSIVRLFQRNGDTFPNPLGLSEVPFNPLPSSRSLLPQTSSSLNGPACIAKLTGRTSLKAWGQVPQESAPIMKAHRAPHLHHYGTAHPAADPDEFRRDIDPPAVPIRKPRCRASHDVSGFRPRANRRIVLQVDSWWGGRMRPQLVLPNGPSEARRSF